MCLPCRQGGVQDDSTHGTSSSASFFCLCPVLGMEREQLEPLVADHLSLQKIATRLATSPTNVRWWLKRYGLQTQPLKGRYAIQREGPCRWHLCLNPASKGGFCSPQCKNKYFVDRRRKALKIKAVTFMGGSCIICGYDKCVGALDFHHLDPTQKDFGISTGNTPSWGRMRAELAKCVLLCNRCHAEIHAGVTVLPVARTAGFEPT